MQKIMYGLKLKDNENILQYSETSNGKDAYACNSSTVELSKYGETDWLVDTYEQALYVKHNSTPWYNSDTENPINSFDADELEIIQIVINTNKMEEKETFKVEPVDASNGVRVVTANVSKLKKKELKGYTVIFWDRDVKNNPFLVEEYDDNFYRVLSMEDRHSIDKFLYIYKSDWKRI